MDFALFVALNAVLLVRPEELVPAIAGLRLYLLVIAGCLVTTGPRVLANLRTDELAVRPVTVCVLGLLAVGALSQLLRGQFGAAVEFVGSFGKVVLYYLLLISVLDTAGRLRAFLAWIVAFVTVLAVLGLLQYHGVIDVEALRPLERNEYEFGSGDGASVVVQLRGTGIYNDPNDLCLILVTGSLCALYRAVTAGDLMGRLFWLAPIGLFGYAVVLTQSRGGVLGLGVAAFVWGYGRFGWKKALLAFVLLAPAASLLATGRQANMSLGKGGTAHERFTLWSDGWNALMRRNPLTGIGVGEYEDVAGLVAHNSFVHAYVEMGLVGGSLFLGAFAVGTAGLDRVKFAYSSDLARLNPFIMSILVGYAAGVFSISRNYVVPTYLVLGLVEAQLRLARQSLPRWFRFDQQLALCLAGLGLLGLIGLIGLTQVLLSM